jgi:glycosyltransferase involved in cell wall biosynthesis
MNFNRKSSGGSIMSSNSKDIVIIVPSYEPDEKMIKLLIGLREASFQRIIVVNDGSSSKYDPFFLRAEKELGCHVLRHAVNLGKGRALKTAFNEVLNNYSDCLGAVSVDSDGQHRLPDIEKCCNALREHPEAMVFGVRSFLKNKEDFIPLKNRLGNIISSVILKMLTGIKVSDTQTGLRGFSRNTMIKILPLKGERFEYEMNMLIETRELDIPILEIPIETIYIDDNASSHFDKVRDSFRIFSLLAKFLIVSVSSFILDISLFTLFVIFLKGNHVVEYILIATFGARLISATFNFQMNRKQVFKSVHNSNTAIVRYILLASIIMLLSAISVKFLYNVSPLGETISKVLVDIFLITISFQVQRDWVFKK